MIIKNNAEIKNNAHRKYLEIAKILFKAQLIYRFDVAFSMLFTITKVLFAYVLWGAIFGEKSEVAGFTFQAMLSYYILSSFISQLDMSGSMGGEIAGKIRGGTFSKYMVVPVSVPGYFGSQTAGASAFYAIFNLIAAVVWTLLFRIQFTWGSAQMISSAAVMCVMGLFFMIELNYFIGILAFKWGDIWIFMMVKNGLVGFVTGTLVPLVMLPEAIVGVMRYLPFYYVTYLPSMLLIGRGGEEIVSGLATLLFWILLFIPVNHFMYKGMRVKYDGVGI